MERVTALHASFFQHCATLCQQAMPFPQQNKSKPYTIVGAGRLVSALWKRTDAGNSWQYRFNVYRMNPLSGRVSRLFRPSDVFDLVKLCQVLAATLVDDGCISTDDRQQLRELAANLDAITNKEL
jgi:hypothetical protein